MRKSVLFVAVVLILLMAACTWNIPDIGALKAPEYSCEITGVIGRFENDIVILLSEETGPVVLEGEMNLDGLKTGDSVTVYCDDIMETYPAQTTVREMILHSEGEELPMDMINNLEGLGYVLEITDPEKSGTYSSISMDEAREIFENKGDYLIVDVRRSDEFESGHIPGAINIANEDINDTMPEELPDKEQTIYVYCRSGNRSKQAAQKLADLGYTDIIEFGGIMDWNGETEK